MFLNERIRNLVTHRFVRDTAVLQVGSMVGTLVQAAAGVLVARILAPELFGHYSLAFSVASIATLVLGAGAADAIAPQVSRAWARGDGTDIRSAYGFFAKFMGAAAVFSVVIVALLPTITARVYGSADIGRTAGIVVAASLVSATVFTLTQLSLQVAGRIRVLAALTLTDTVARYAFVILLAVVGGVTGAVSGHLTGAVILAALSAALFGRLAANGGLLPRLRDLPALARATPWRPLIQPTLWVMADRNLAMLYGALPVAMVGVYATASEVAYFKLSFGYLMLSMSVLGPISTLLNVRFPTLQAVDGRRLRSSFIRVTGYATLLSAGITAVVLATAPLVFRILYGAEYLPSVPYVYGFGLFGALFGAGVGLGPLWRAVDRVHVSILINLATLAGGVPLGIWLIGAWHLWGAVAMVTAWYTVSHGVSLWYLMRVLKNDTVAPA